MSARRVALSLGLVLCLASVTALAQSTSITVLHVSDSHSYLAPVGPKDDNLNGTLGGIAKAATVIGMTKMTEPNVLTLHGGDVFHGTLFFNNYFGIPELQMLQQLGFDAMAVGNHEFDYGPDVLAYALSTAYGYDTLPLLSANLDITARPELGLWIKPSMIKEIDGVKVGIFGMTVPGIPTSMPDPVVILGGEDPAVLMGIAYQNAAALRAQGADVVIMLSHLGVLYDQAVATNVPGIDIIFGGHDHQTFAEAQYLPNPAGGQTVLVHSGKHLQRVGKLRFTINGSGVTVDEWSLIELDENVPAEPTLAAVVEQLKLGIMQRYGDVFYDPVAYALWDIKNTYNPAFRSRDTGMGNLITDAMRFHAGTKIAVTANGLISDGLTAGHVVGADLFRPVSYGYDQETGLGFKLVTFDMTGAEIIKGLEIGLAQLEYTEDLFLQVSGMRFKYDSTKPPGQRVILDSVRVGRKALDPFATYSVTVNEGIAMLLPAMGVQVTNMVPLPDLEYNVLRDYAGKYGWLFYTTQGRIKDEGADCWLPFVGETDPAAEAAPPAEMTGGCQLSPGAATPMAGLFLAMVLGLAWRRRR